jgi:NADH-quinone oxidoreductase subunit C
VEALEQIKARLETAFPGISATLVPNGSPGNPASLLVAPQKGLAVFRWLKEDPALQLDFLSNVTGVDWPEKVVEETVPVKRQYRGEEIEVDETITKTIPGCLEVVYHLYSTTLKHGPVVLRMRTVNRADQVRLPSLVPLYRSADFQEREVFDLFGVVFEGHPDLRRLLMWEQFADFPMRKDYVEPDDYQYEPTPHGTVLEKARKHYPKKSKYD